MTAVDVCVLLTAQMCTSDEHECDGGCLSSEKICDGQNDCMDMSDEQNCDSEYPDVPYRLSVVRIGRVRFLRRCRRDLKTDKQISGILYYRIIIRKSFS